MKICEYKNGKVTYREMTLEEINYWEKLWISIEQLKITKLNEISTACNTAINNGTQVQLSDGTTKQFSYALEDQSNISEMFTAVMVGATSYPYHADGENCVVYSAQDIIAIYSTLTGFKTAQTTYHNQLKAYVQSLDNAQDVMAVQYGQELTGEYLEKYNQLMAVAQGQMEIILSKLTQTTS